MSRLARLHRRAPGAVEWLAPRLAGRANREAIGTARHVLRPYLPRDYASDAAPVPGAVGAPVEAVVHVQAGWDSDDPAGETRWLETLPFGRNGAPALAAIVGHADPREPGFAATLDAHAAASERFRGIRCIGAWHPDPKVRNWADGPGVLAAPAFLRGFEALAERGLTFDAWVYSEQLPDVLVLAREYPDTTIVLDHYGTPVGLLAARGRDAGRTPTARDALLARWRDDISALAELPNVVAKHSGLAFPPLGFDRPGIDRATLAELLAPLVDHTTEVFGPDRLMFGSNFPMDKAVAAYPTVAGALGDILKPHGAATLRKVFRENAERIYGLTLPSARA